MPVFAYEVLKQLRSHLPEAIKSSHWMIAVSSGRDSMVLWDLVRHWQSRLQLKISVCYVHHGVENVSSEQVAFRHEAMNFVRERALAHGEDFFCNWRASHFEEPESQSEEGLRRLRKQCFQKWMVDSKADILLLGHHQMDQLETRLIRLIRGCSGDGLRAMQVLRESVLRPLLNVDAARIEDYARAQQIPFLCDPSNENTQYLRNWIRHQWLDSLEGYRPGSVLALGRSLEGVVNELEPKSLTSAMKSKDGQVYLDIPLLLSESETAQKRSVAQFLQQRGCDKFTLGQISEVLRRLLTGRKTDKFDLAGLAWNVNAGRVQANRIIKGK